MLSLLLVALARFDVLSDLIAKSAEVRGFTAAYDVTSNVAAANSTIRIEYGGPQAVRVDRIAGDKLTSMWCVDGVFSMSSNEGKEPLYGRADSRAIYAELDPIERGFAAACPAYPARGESRSSVGMRWAFDTKEQKANWVIDTEISDSARSPFGWLETLAQKNAVATEDGEALRFETDGAFQIALQKSTGFLAEFHGRSPTGEMHVLLKFFELAAPAPERFVVAKSPEGARDISTELSKGLNRVAELSVRRRCYLGLAGGDAAPWDDAAKAKYSAALRPFFARSIAAAMAPIMEDAGKKREGIKERLAKLRESGKTPEEIEAVRRKEIGYLKDRLDNFESRFLALSANLPAGADGLPHAQDLLVLEKSVISAVFDELVRTPLLADFEKANPPVK